MTEKLNEVERRLEQVNEKLCLPETAADPKLSAALGRERKRLEPIVEKFREYKAALADIEDGRTIIDDAGADPELRELAREQIDEARKTAEECENELKIMLLPRDPNDDKNVIVEIRGGAGGEESALFAAVLFRMYSMYSERRGFGVEVVSSNETELGGFKEISFTVSGDGAYSRFKFEGGVHRVQRVPETEAGGRIHTSTVTVAVLPEAEEVDLELDEADLQIDTFRSSGAGGQKVNKTSSAIRVTHIPTGMVVECQDERSQYRNKDKALSVLRSRLLAEKRQAQADEIGEQRRSMVGTGDRSERIRTYNYAQGRVTDHRIGLTLYKLDAILNGDMDEVIDSLITADTAKKLQVGEDSA